jgi:glycosyltransferase involved in cell wall biosynthesis
MISVIVATYNGESVLPLTLQAFTELRLPSQEIEFIVVDNASTDGTSDVIKEFSNLLPITYLKEERKGKAFAIHTGIAASGGSFVIMTDDDVIPDKNWLVEYENLANTKQDYSVFLGQIKPYWLKTPPDWLQQLAENGRSCGCTNSKADDGEITFHSAKGANIGVRREVLDKVAFREDLWIAGENKVGGEDTDFVRQAAEHGFKLWFSKKISLQHIVKPHEITMRAVCKRYFRIGRSISAVTPKSTEHGKLVFGYPRWIVSSLFKMNLIVCGYFLIFQRYKAMSKMLDMAILYGKAYQNKLAD